MATVAMYRQWMASYAGMRLIDVWYSHITEADIRAAAEPFLAKVKDTGARRARLDALFSKARGKDGLKAASSLTSIVEGKRQFNIDPPVVQRMEMPGGPDAMRTVFEDYRATMAESRREFLERFRFADFALKVVGVGSVGTRCLMLVLEGRDQDDPLILQAKEATASVLEEFAGGSGHANHGERVVVGPAPDAGHPGHLPGLDPRPGWPRLLRAPAVGHEGQRRRRHAAARGSRLLRRHLRLGARPGPCPHRRLGGHHRLPRQRRRLRRRGRRLRRDLRRPERQGPRGLRGGHHIWTSLDDDGHSHDHGHSLRTGRQGTVGYVRRIANLYRTQVELLWRWRGGRRALAKRAIVSFVAGVIAFWITAWLLPQLDITETGGAIIAVIVISVLNLLVRPVILGLVASRSVAALVLLTLLFQAFVIWLLGPFVPAVAVHGGLISALIISFFFGGIAGAIGLLFGLDEDESYYGTLVRTLASRRPDVTHTTDPGLVVIQLDGLSHDVLSHSIRAGRVPEISRWLRTGTHRLGHWDALLPSTTPASQAGILQGNNDGIPNFRWLEKDTGRILVANHPDDATVIESRVSNGEGLLSMGGASIGNIFTGDADRAFLVMSTIKVKERGLGDSDAFAWFFVSPYNYINMIVRYLAEMIKEEIQSRRQARAGIEPRMHRGFPYPAVRAATNVGLRSLGSSLVIQEMLRGTPAIYIDYTDYDEIAHHSGPERPESLDALDGVDRELRTLLKASADAPRPYRFVVLADHGQSLGATFLQRFGVTLQDVVRSLMGGSASVTAATAQIEDWGQLNTFLGEVSQTKGVTGSLARTVTRGQRADGHVDLGPAEAQYTAAGAPTANPGAKDGGARTNGDGAKGTKGAKSAAPADLVVVAGGNLALIYFNASKERMTLEAIGEHYPELMQALANHPGIGVLIVRSAANGLIAVGKEGINYLDEERIEGTDPLAVYGDLAATAVKRLDAIEHVGDIAVISHYDPETGEIAAFEELIGAHGGLGGAQTRPFLLYPSDWELNLGPIIGAPMVYQQLRHWMETKLGMHFGKPGAVEPRAATAGSQPPLDEPGPHLGS